MTFQTDIRRIKGLTADTKSLIQVRVHTFVNQYYGDYFTCKKIGQFQAHNSWVLKNAHISVTTTIMKYNVSITPNNSPSHPSPRQPLICYHTVLSFPGFHRKAILDISFVFDFSLKITLLRFIQTARWAVCSFHCNQHFTVWLSHSSSDRWLGVLEATMNKATRTLRFKSCLNVWPHFSRVNAQEWVCWVIWWVCVALCKNCQTVFKLTILPPTSRVWELLVLAPPDTGHHQSPHLAHPRGHSASPVVLTCIP